MECPSLSRYRADLYAALNAEHATHVILPRSNTGLTALSRCTRDELLLIHDTILGGPVTDNLTNSQYDSLMHATKNFLCQSFALKAQVEPPPPLKPKKKGVKSTKKGRWKGISKYIEMGRALAASTKYICTTIPCI